MASAVDEANSSDSEETFVYESNPPEPAAHRSGRHHSRTPSSTSLQSQMEHRAVLLANHSLVGKRSMKFASNSPYIGAGPEHELVAGADHPGLGRGSGRGGVPAGSHAHHHHHHHVGHHWGHTGRVANPALFDSASPFPHGYKPYRSGTASASRQSSRATSPRNMHHQHLGSVAGNKLDHLTTYDMDVEGGADDERTPLMLSNRMGRRGVAGGGGTLRGAEYIAGSGAPGRWRTWLNRFAGCLVLTLMVLLVIVGALAFFLVTTRPLREVRVLEIQNVLASKQEIMLDLLVEAINPNVIALTVGDMDVNVFAKSRYVGSELAAVRGYNKEDGVMSKRWSHSLRLSRAIGRLGSRYRPALSSSSSSSLSSSSHAPCHSHSHMHEHEHKNVDEGTDPIPDPDENDSHTMLLGRIFHFDAQPSFDGSPLTHQRTSSIGQVRLARPGNRTEEGGSARWEAVLQHPFHLIVRGVLKYQLPLSNRLRTAPIGASVLVYPEGGPAAAAAG